MTDDIPNQTLSLLREMRTEISAIRKDTTELKHDFRVLDAKFNAMAQTQVGMLARLDKIDRDLGEFKSHVGVMAIAVDEHSTRLQRIENILGQPRHNA